MQKQISDKEVDLIELLLEIWSKKFKILLITLICVILGVVIHFSNDERNKTIFKINSEVHPISLVDETKYISLNSYVYQYHSDIRNIDLTIAANIAASEGNHVNFSDRYKPSEIESLNFDKELLFTLFVKKMSSQKNLENYLDEFKLYKKNDFKNDLLLIDSFSEIINSVKNVNLDNPKNFNIEIQTYEYDQTLEFLQFINKNINNEVKNEINDIFASHIETKKLLKQFELDDIEKSLEIFSQSVGSRYLIQKKKFLLSDKYLVRLKEIYSDLPLSDANKFYAAKIIYQSSTSKSLNRLNKILIVSALVGVLIGIIIVLTSNAVRMRQVK